MMLAGDIVWNQENDETEHEESRWGMGSDESVLWRTQ